MKKALIYINTNSNRKRELIYKIPFYTIKFKKN